MTNEPILREVELISPDRKKHGSRKRISPERQRVFNERIEMARTLLRENWTDGDIRRAFKRQYGIGSRQTAQYLILAYKRNCQILDRSEDEITANSLGFWASQQRQCAERIQQAKASINDAEQEISAARLILESPNASAEKQKIAVARIREANRQKDDARRTIYSAEQIKMNCQDRIDRILSPGKYSHPDASADGNLATHPTNEPINTEQSTKAFLDIISSLEKRQEGSEPCFQI